MKTHELKTWPLPFAEAAAGRKAWEWRRNDRNFKVGDHVLRREYDPKNLTYTGRALPLERIVYVFADGFDLPHGYAILSLERVPVPPRAGDERPWRPGEVAC